MGKGQERGLHCGNRGSQGDGADDQWKTFSWRLNGEELVGNAGLMHRRLMGSLVSS